MPDQCLGPDPVSTKVPLDEASGGRAGGNYERLCAEGTTDLDNRGSGILLGSLRLQQNQILNPNEVPKSNITRCCWVRASSSGMSGLLS